MIGGGVFLGMLNYVFTVVMAHAFSVSDFGEFQVYMNLVVMLSVLGGALSPYAVRMAAVAQSQDVGSDFNRILSLYRHNKPRVFGLLAVCILILMLCVTHFIAVDGLVPFFIILCTAVVATLGGIFSGIVQGLKSFFHFNTVNIGSALVKIGLCVILAVLTKNPGLALIGFFISQLSIFYFFERKTITTFPQSSRHEPAKMGNIFTPVFFRDIIYTFLYSASLSVLFNGDILLAQISVHDETLGLMSVFLIIGKMILYSNVALMNVVLPYIAGSKESETPVIAIGYGILSSIGAGGIALFKIFPMFMLHTVFHAPMGTGIESILWQSGVIALLLSFMTLEATIAYASKVPRFVGILVASTVLFAISMAFFGGSIQALAYVLMYSYGIGWLLLLANRLLRAQFASR